MPSGPHCAASVPAPSSAKNGPRVATEAFLIDLRLAPACPFVAAKNCPPPASIVEERRISSVWPASKGKQSQDRPAKNQTIEK